MCLKDSFYRAYLRLKAKILDFIFLYDPGYLNFFYSLKTFISCVISVVVSYFLFGSSMLMWAALIPIHFYFLNVTFVRQDRIFTYFCLFVIFLLVSVVLFYNTMFYGLWLIAPLVFMGFLAVILSSYDFDLQKIINMSVINGLIACAYERLNPDFILMNGIKIILVASIITFFMHFCINSKKHGKFVRRYLPNLFFTLELMLNYIHKNAKFIQFCHQAQQQIDFLKRICDSKGGRVKDEHMIKNNKRNIFYLYRLEEIYQCITTLHDDGLFNSKEFGSVKKEIIYNLRQLSTMFEGHRPYLKKNELEKCQNVKHSVSFLNIIKILYSKMESLRRGGEEKDYFLEAESKKSLRVILNALKWNDVTFRYAVKYAMVLGISVWIAEVFHISHGVWITMSCVAISKPSLGGVNSIGKSYLIGVVLGILIGILVVHLTYPGLAFKVCFALVVFAFVYFRVYPYGLWSSFMMMAFIMMFSLIYGYSFQVIMDRLMDILLAFGLSFLVFFILWPRYSGNDVVPTIKKMLQNLIDSNEVMIKNIENLNFQKNVFNQYQRVFFSHYNYLSLCLNEAKNEKIKRNRIDSKSMRKDLKYLNFLNQNTLKINYFLIDHGKMSEKELYINDLKLIQTRYEMIIRALDNNSFYLKEQKDDRFLSTDEDFNEVINMLFDAQNRLFSNLKNGIYKG